MIGWARSEEALTLEHGALEERAMADGMEELMRLLAQAHLDLRALREQRRDDVRDADGHLRRTAEGGQERTRVMIFGPVGTSRTAYRRKGKENLCPQDAELNWAAGNSYSAGAEKRAARAAAIVPFEQAAAQVSAAGAIRLGKRQAEELAVGAAADFDAFYASRRPGPCPAQTGLLITCDGSAFPVLPRALRPATAKAAGAGVQQGGSRELGVAGQVRVGELGALGLARGSRGIEDHGVVVADLIRARGRRVEAGQQLVQIRLVHLEDPGARLHGALGGFARRGPGE